MGWKQERDIELKERNKSAKILIGETIVSAKIIIKEDYDDMSDLILKTKSGKKIRISGYFNEAFTGNSESEYQCFISIYEDK